MEDELEKLMGITSPKIDIELCTRDNNLPPINKVFSMDDHSFEEFINEWLYGCYSNKYSNIQIFKEVAVLEIKDVIL